MTQPDLMQRLTNARPTHDELASNWSAEGMAAMWHRLERDASRPPSHSRHRRRIALLAVAATVVGFAAVPTVLDSGSASARADLLHLALVAAKSDSPVIAPGSYLHIKTEAVQKNSHIFGDGQTLDTNRDAWIRWDGATWAVDTRPSAGWTEYHYFAPPEDISFGTPTPAFVAGLPNDADGMRSYLDKTVSGSNSHNEALFVAVSDLANSGMLDRGTFAVALEILAGVDGVDTNDVAVDGHDAVEVRYNQHFGIGLLGSESFTVDRETAQVLSVRDSDPGGTYVSRTTAIEAVNQVPEDVLTMYDRYPNGTRICADGSEANEDCPEAGR